MWYLQRRNSRPIGPVTTEDVVDGLKTGEIPRDTLVCAADGKQWLPLDAVPELAEGLAGKTVPDSPPSFSVESGDEPAEKRQPSRPRPRIVRRLDPMPSPLRARAALAASGASLAVSFVAVLVVFAPTAALAELLDAVHALRPALSIGGALGIVAASVACAATIQLERGRAEARSLARAPALPFGASLVAIGVGLFTVGRGLAAIGDVSRARSLLTFLLVVSVSSALAWATLIGRALFAGRESRRDALTVAAVAVAAVLLAIGARGAAARADVVNVDGPLFADESSLVRYVEGLRAGASGLRLLDETLATAVFVPKGTRARYLDELVVDAHAGGLVVRKVELLDGPSAGRTVYLPSSKR